MPEISRIINKKYHIPSDKIDVFSVEDSYIKSIQDRETGLIEFDALDSVSKVINDTFEKLFDLDEEE